MALRGFSCPNCRTWFEGEGNHPRCPLCGTRASPRDLLDDREQKRAKAEQAATSWEFEEPDFTRPQEYEVPTREAPDYEAPAEQPPDYETPQGGDAAWSAGTDRQYEAPAGEPGRRQEEASGADWGERIGPLIGAAIFIAVIASRVCSAVTGSE